MLPTDPNLSRALKAEGFTLSHVDVPIVTISATFKKELIERYDLEVPPVEEAVFSRAHYSMAEAVRHSALKHHHSTHLVDPTNFVHHSDWGKIEFTENVGQLMARHKSLKWLKDQIDSKVRNKLPITDAITPPLLYLTQDVAKPIISLHYEAGNIVATQNKRMIQVLTDPHVRPQYLDPLPNNDNNNAANKFLPLITFAVFDLHTRRTFFEMAQSLGKQINKNQVIVTGPPVDPRVIHATKLKKIYTPKRSLNIAITTGGLGTNLDEIKILLESLKSLITPPNHTIKLFLYASTHRDFRNTFENFAHKSNLVIGNLEDDTAPVRILYEDSPVDANDNLIKYMFPWADAIITKPSGDMAYDAAASGAVGLYLEPWGPWEQNIQTIFTHNGCAFDIKPHKAKQQLQYLIRTGAITKAARRTRTLPKIFTTGTKNLIALQQKLSGNV